MMQCSVHGKNRTAQNLEDDGMGGYKCTAESQCQTAQQMMQRQSAQQMAGDWNCPQCGDHQFARNQVCRKCGGPKPDDAGFQPGFDGGCGGGMMGKGGMMGAMMSAMMGQMGMGGKGNMGGNKPLTAAEKEIQKLERDMAMLSQQLAVARGGGTVQQRTPMQSQGMTTNQMNSGGLQMSAGKVMKKVRVCVYFEKGTCTRGDTCTFAHGEHEIGQPQIPGMIEVPNPKTGETTECSLHGRSRTLNNLMEDGQGGFRCAPGFECQVGNPVPSIKGNRIMPGDWNCPSCGDHQFARNMECRKCGAANPNPGEYAMGNQGKGGDGMAGMAGMAAMAGKGMAAMARSSPY